VDYSETIHLELGTVSLHLVLVTKGTSPAEDIDLFFDFPDGFELYTARDLPRRPAEPKPPEKPVGGFAGLLPSVFPSLLGLHNLRLPDVAPRNVSSPQIRQTNSYEVNIHVKELKHNLVEGLPRFMLSSIPSRKHVPSVSSTEFWQQTCQSPF
jgi:hypothetical protein